MMRGFVLFLACMICAGIAAAENGNGGAKNWPQWRGPNAQGVSEAKGLPEKWSATENKKENIKWTAELPGKSERGGNSSPCVWGDRVFLTASVALGGEIRKGNPEHPQKEGPMSDFRFTKYQFRTLCFDRLTGKSLWMRPVPFENPTQSVIMVEGDYANPTPATDGEIVVVSFGIRWLLAYDMEGALKWRYEMPDEDPISPGSDGNSPIIVGDRVVAVREASNGPYIVALNKQNGQELWKVKRDEEIGAHSTPVLADVDGKKQILTSNTRVRSYDYATGAVVWECGGLPKGVIPTIVLGHGLMFAASSGPTTLLEAIKLGRTGDLTGTDAVAWKTDRGVPHVPTPLVYGDELYVPDDKGILSCFEAKTGKLRYDRTRLHGINELYASPVAAEGKIYFLSEEGTMVTIKAGPSFEVLATNEIPGKFRATPALVDGMILLRSDKHLYAIAQK